MLSIVRLFADDSSFSVAATNLDDIEGILNHDLCLVSNWSKQWLVDFNPAKTEIMFFSLNNENRRPRILFNNIEIDYVEHHKHLGLTFSDNGKWHQHIDNIVSSASKVLGLLRLLKFKLNRKTLNQIYISYMRPILEYASVVWDGCTNYEKDKLDKLQYEAARLVTGLTRSVSIVKLNNEIGWLSLRDRRKLQKYIIMYKVNNGITPDYLSSLYPPLIENATPYNLRNSNNYVTIPRRLEIFSNSFIPSSVKLWNALPLEIRSSKSLLIFKNAMLRTYFNVPVVPKFYYSGPRSLCVIHTRIRNNCSNLNNDLFNNHLKESSSCECGDATENAEHYFFRCNIFSDLRIQMFHSLCIYHPLSLDKLLFGDSLLSDTNNVIIFEAVQTYIKDTHRF